MRTTEKPFLAFEEPSKCCNDSEPGRFKNFLDYEIMMASHDWRVEATKENGNSGLLIVMKCKRCNADRVGIFSPGH
jgi:hypothetical protein